MNTNLQPHVRNTTNTIYSDALLSHTRLQERMTYSKELLCRVREAVSKKTNCGSSNLCVFAAGSLGRHETGQKSDLDVFLIADRRKIDIGREGRREEGTVPNISRLDEIMTLSELIQVNQELQLEPFSGDGRYLKIQEISDLLTGTGSSTDDSENFFTTRLLLLLESKCIANDELYNKAIKKIISMYFRDGREREGFKPLFLLNDILRYWRTLCLNYERSRNEPGKPWWKKNLNLKFSRKLTIFSSVLAIIAGHIHDHNYLYPLISKTPLERLAYSLDKIGDDKFLSDFNVFLNNYEDFLAAKSNSEFEATDQQKITRFSGKADQFDDLLHSVLTSTNLDKKLVRYVSI